MKSVEEYLMAQKFDTIVQHNMIETVQKFGNAETLEETALQF